MPFKLRVEFEFLCAFVPALSTPNDQKMFVLLPDLRQGLSVNGAEIGHHFGVLRYHVAQGSPDPGLGVDPDSLQHGLGLRGILLDGFDVRFLPGGKEAPNTAPSFDFSRHLIGMELAAKLLNEPGYGEVDPHRTSAAKPTAKGMDLAARLTLRGGRLEPQRLTSLTFDLHLAGTQPVTGIYLQEVSRQVRWTFEVQHDFVDIAFKRFASASESRLRIRPEGDDPVVVLAIRNCEREFKYATGLPDYGNERQELMAFLPLSKAYNPQDPPQQLFMTSRANTVHGACTPSHFPSQ